MLLIFPTRQTAHHNGVSVPRNVINRHAPCVPLYCARNRRIALRKDESNRTGTRGIFYNLLKLSETMQATNEKTPQQANAQNGVTLSKATNDLINVLKNFNILYGQYIEATTQGEDFSEESINLWGANDAFIALRKALKEEISQSIESDTWNVL